MSQASPIDGTDQAKDQIVVVGAGIAGLTAAALLARAGQRVLLLEAHHQSGGCAGSFRRGPYRFDVGATQVAGLEPGGSHARLLAHLQVEPPAASPLDPACVVQLGDGSAPIQIWRDPKRWQAERLRQFPGSQKFWQLAAALHRANWAFAAGDPVLPPRSLWDLGQLLGALKPNTLASGLLAGSTVADLLWLCGCSGDSRLRRFLDLQLKLYSQEPADRTAALYGATVLAIAQEPLGLWHLEGSMQALASCLERALARWGGELRLRQRVRSLRPLASRGARAAAGGWRVEASGPGDQTLVVEAADVVCSLPPQGLPALLGPAMPASYARRIEALGEPSGALVLYGAVDRRQLPATTAAHLQLDWPDPGPLFVSVSLEGDGRAPAGQATVIASVFTAAKPWLEGGAADYSARKQLALRGMQQGLQQLLGIAPSDWLHAELATPKSFAHWTGRPHGYVGGIGQHPSRFGPFGLASRTPLPGLWLCGDSIYPGEGTAGVSLSALTAARQLLERRGHTLTLS
jgi:C-3',4' desaturase CrtD